MNKLIEIEHVMACYGKKVVLPDASLMLYDNDFLGIIGSNGGGKTTLLKVILGLLPPVKGHLSFFREGKKTTSIRTGYLPQMSLVDREFPITVREVIASGLASEKPLFRSFSRTQNRRIEEVGGLMGISELAGHPIGELSGGQLQRVLLGRAIVSDPELLVLDEPTSYIDKHFESRFYDLLKDINRKSAVIFVSHDVNMVRTLAKRIVLVENGQLTIDD